MDELKKMQDIKGPLQIDVSIDSLLPALIINVITGESLLFFFVLKIIDASAQIFLARPRIRKNMSA
ncbi:glycosylphosphatidylinositol anchor attachment 1 protein-like [Gossypium australe]|uniref:Glycosylphosphatidylinositol anchor attachment 1 protein-like n=1 Tax=Gossypium australe TaxID=47621 RepID=A0A5B6V5N9_9ROSI|nr:glycosylphosphatidylinositol anchor attachment 1 protein-like [Gossypium australe]